MFELLRNLYQDFFSKPAHYRSVFRAIRKTRVKSIVQIGIGSGELAKRMIATAQKANPDQSIQFTGVDLFEARPVDQEKCSLIDAHRMFNETGVKAKLMPGDPYSALSRIANSISNADLLIVSADQDLECMEKAWFYVPRFLSEKAIILIESVVAQDKFVFDWLERNEVQQMAQKSHHSSNTKKAA